MNLNKKLAYLPTYQPTKSKQEFNLSYLVSTPKHVDGL